MSNIIHSFLHYAKNHSILIHPETRKIGIRDTLVGWALIALSTVLFQHSIQSIPSPVNFLIQFLTATVVLLIASVFNGLDFLKIKHITPSSNIANNHRTHQPHFSIKNRKLLLYGRGIIATGGYMLYSWARASINMVDNSAIFSADAIAYALMMYFFLKEKITNLQWLGIIIASFGVSYIFIFDFQFSSWFQAIAGGGAGLLSSFSLAIIILLNTVIVQHEPPLRIAFYQCLVGLIIASILVIIQMLLGIEQLRLTFPPQEILYSISAGLIYAISLLFFFSAFLYTEPLIISILGYALVPFVGFFDWIIFHNIINAKDLVSSFFIAIGGSLAIFGEFHKGQKKKMNKTITQPNYGLSLRENMQSLKEKYKTGKMHQLDYMSLRHEFNKLLFQFSDELSDSNIDKIEILPHAVIFTLNQLKIKMVCDGGCRSAPFEILNFSHYEKDESELLFRLIKDGDIIFDVGAHIGWYAINFAKTYPNARIFSFEPIPYTYACLEKNIELNNVKNVKIYNYALSDQEGIQSFFYFRGGSALSSTINLIEHDKTEEIKCESRQLDHIWKSLSIDRLDILKCDVEGSELATLRGGIHTISKFKPIIYIEVYNKWCEKFGYSPNEILHLLENVGYQCFSRSNGVVKQEMDLTQQGEIYNFFFLHGEKHADSIQEITKYPL